MWHESPTELPSDVRLTLHSLGDAKLVAFHADGLLGVVLDAGKPLALIAYLAAAAQLRASREHALDLIWADLQPDAAKHALRQTLWYIKRKVGDGIIATSGDALQLSPAIDSDRAQLIAAAELGNHAQVVGLYKGDFFARFAAPGGAEFEQWADVERRRLRNLFYRSADSEVHRLLTSGRARDAVALARRARDLDRTHQPAWRLLLEALIAADDVTGAQLEADALEAFTPHNDVELEPSTLTVLRLARQATNNDQPKTNENRSLVAELVGREREFAEALAAWESARNGLGRHLHIRGAAGLGKTRLLNDLHARLRASRARVRIVRLRIGTREVPYVAAAAIASALADLPGAKGFSPESAAALLALNPALSSVFQSGTSEASNGEDALTRRAVALKDLLITVSEDHAVALLLDDVHWSDTQSRTLLGQLVDEVEQRKVLLVTTGRPTAPGRIETPHTLTLDLPPLDAEATHALVTSLASLAEGQWTTTFINELLRTSLGSPLRTLETLQLLMDQGLLERREHDWHAGDSEKLIATLREGDALQRRITQLNRSERWLLLLLAVAGVPVPAQTVCEISALSEAECQQSLTTLEAHGLVAQQGDVVMPAHDELSEAAIELARTEARRAAHTAIGKHLWQRSTSDLGTLRRAAGHLAQAEESAALSATFLRFVRESRRLDDMRSHVALADDLLGSLTSAARVSELVRSLPLHVRLGLTSTRRVAAAAVVAATIPLSLAITAAITIRDAPSPDADLVVFAADNEGGLRGGVVPLHSSAWSVDNGIGVPRRADIYLSVPVGAMPFEVPGSPGLWMYSAAVPDSGVIDLFTMEDGEARRLTHASGDDMVQSVSPDGRFAVIATARWHSLSHYDLAVMELATGSVRQLTATDETEGSAQWSHDGTQIAFLRRSFTHIESSVCRIAFDASQLSCMSVHDATQVLGWVDEANVLVVRGAKVGHQLAVARFDNDDVVAVRPDLTVRNASMSPNGRFVACLCTRRGTDDWRWLVWPAGRDLEARVVAHGAVLPYALGWRAPRSRAGLLSLTLHQTPNLQVDVPHQFSASGVSHDGRVTQPRWLRWTSTDSRVIEIDSATGLAIPRAHGTAVIAVDASGVARSAATVRVTERRARQVMSEPWTVSLDRDWLVIGTPRPYRDTVGGRTVLRPNGDGSHESGVMSRQPITLTDGAALDAELSIRVTLPQWQTIGLGFEDIDTSAWPSEDRVRGQLPREYASCLTTFPPGENAVLADSIGMHTSWQEARTRAPAGARDGDWFRVRVQVFPDGRCGIALDGRPVFLSTRTAGLGPNTRVHLYGHSYSTDALLGRTTVWRGVPNDVDWAAFERQRQKQPSLTPRAMR